MGTLEVLLVDNHLLAVVKPAGVPVVPDASGDESLLDRARAWVRREFEKPGEAFLGVVHRLDRPVSGLVLFARTSKAAARLSQQFRDHAVRKLYLAVSEGEVRGTAGGVEQWLLKDHDSNRVRVPPGPCEGARLARTDWRVLAVRSHRTLLELEPHTGRPHQLRVAAATALGAPLLGDVKYGASRPLEDRSVALHAWKLEVEHPTRHLPISLGCPVPVRPWWAGWESALPGRGRS